MKRDVKTTEKKSKVSDIVVNVFLVFAIVVAITCSYTAYTAKAGSGVPTLFGFRPFSVQTDSMAPTFYHGDLVIDRVVDDPKTLKEGDIITFWTVINGQKVLNTHRIIGISDYGNYLYFDTKGDNNTIADSTGVHQNEIVGVYLTHLKGVGLVLDFLQTSQGFFLCIVLPVALFFVYQLFVFFRTLMAYQAEKVRLQIQQESAKKEQEAPQTKEETEDKEETEETEEEPASKG